MFVFAIVFGEAAVFAISIKYFFKYLILGLVPIPVCDFTDTLFFTKFSLHFGIEHQIMMFYRTGNSI